MDLVRSVLAATLAGTAASGAASLAYGDGAPNAALAGLEARAGPTATHPRRAAAPAPPAILASAPPLFPVLSGPNAARELALRLDGVARSPGRSAALLSMDGGAAEWLQLGDSRYGVTLLDVAPASVTVDTPRGRSVVKLGEGPTTPPADTTAAPGPASSEAPPAGWRGREPASAPGVGP